MAPGTPDSKDLRPDLSRASEVMKKEWEERAVESAMHYVVSGRPEMTEDEFFESGRINTQEQISSDLERITGDVDPKQMVVLEIGCGIGRMTRCLADIFGRVVGIDVSPEMIAQARKNLAGIDNVEVHETSGADLAMFDDAAFDFCFSYIVFQHIPYRDAIVNYFREVHRTLKPGCLFKFQVHGLMPVHLDTWHGVGFTEPEMLELADEIGFDVVGTEGQGTQYFWSWWIRR